MLHGFLHIQNLTAQGQDGLEVAVAALLGGAACRVTLHEEELALCRVLGGAVGELAWQSGTAEGGLALHELAGFSGGVARLGGQHHLVDDGLRVFRVLLQIVGQHFAHHLVHHAGNLAVAEFGLGLAFELRLGHLHGDDGGESLAEVVAGNLDLGLFQLVEQLVVVGVFLEGAGERLAEAREVRAALYRVDVVDVGVDVLGEGVVVLHGDLHGHALLLALNVDGLRRDLGAALVEVHDEVAQTVLGVVDLLGMAAVFVGPAQVLDGDVDALVQVGKLFETVRETVELIDGGVENRVVGQEGDLGAAVVARAEHFHGVEGLAVGVLLDEVEPVAEDLGGEVLGEGVHAGDADAVQTAGDLVGVLVELAAGVQDGHDDLQGGALLLGMHVGGDAAPVVEHADGIAFQYFDFDVVAESGEGLVDGVIDHLVD